MNTHVDVCPHCKGTKKIQKTDILNARRYWERCDKCGGSGMVSPKPQDGLYVEVPKGKPLYLQWYVDGTLVSHMSVRVIPVFTEAGKPSHIVAEIDGMDTSKKHRRLGYMSKIMNAIQTGFMNGEVKYVLTNWHDSSDAGKKFLLKHGFERKGRHLVWKRNTKES